MLLYHKWTHLFGPHCILVSFGLRMRSGSNSLIQGRIQGGIAPNLKPTKVTIHHNFVQFG